MMMWQVSPVALGPVMVSTLTILPAGGEERSAGGHVII